MISQNNSAKKTSFAWPIIISVISLILSFLSIEHDIFFSLPPFFSSGIEKFDCSIRKDERERSGMTYIFVLDTSTSYNTQKINPAWFNYQRKKINDFLADPAHDFGNTGYSKPPLFMLCKVKLCQTILELRHENANFEIWTLGDNAAGHYWGTFGETVAGRESVKKAIKEIVHIPQSSLNTDFVSLFARIFENHKDLNLMKVPPTEHNLPGVVLVLVSDLLHDVKIKLNLNPNRNDFEGRLDEQKRDLNSIIDKISAGNIVVDVIELKPRRIGEHEIPVWEILNRNKFLGSRLKKISIENESIESLFPTINSLNRIIFYYNYTSTILKSSVYLKFDKIGNYSIGLDPDKDNSKKSLKYEVMNVSNGNKEFSAGKAGNFIAGGNFVQFKDLKPYESIKLTCSTFSPGQGFPDLKISFLDKEKINYSIPIVFKKKPLPLKQNIYVWAVFILLSLIFFLLIQLFYRSSRFLKFKFSIYAKSKEKSALKPQEDAANVSVTDAEIDKGNLVTCPYPECPSDYHPQGTVFCPHSGKPLGASYKIKKRLLIISIVLAAKVISIVILLAIINTTAKPKLLMPNGEQNSSQPNLPPKTSSTIERHLEESIRREYKSHFNNARQNYDNGEFERALENIKKAIDLKKTDEAEDLRRKIITIINGQGKVIALLKLPQRITDNYHAKMETINIRNIPKTTNVRGQITLFIEVSERGYVRIKNFKYNNMDVLPYEQSGKIREMISKRVREISLSPPQNESGWPVKVSWRIRFNVIIIEGKLVLIEERL
jgi:hypothetical protein